MVINPVRAAKEMWQRARNAAKSRNQAIRFVLEYFALRLWMLLIFRFPINANLVTARMIGRIWPMLFKRHLDRAMDNLRPAFPEKSEEELTDIAKRAMQHFAQLYLVEFAMTPRLVNQWTWSRYVTLPENIGETIRELLSDRGTIMVTPHFGNYELLGYTVAKLGLQLSAVMRPLDNPLVNDHLLEAREAGGLSLLYKKGATENAGNILATGGTLCFIADQDAGRKGIFVDFFGRKASWYKSIGLLAMQQRVPIVVGAAARVRPGFHYQVEVERIIQPEEWEAVDNPLEWVTTAFANGLESIIRRHPEQYLWMHRRWKSRPKEERQKNK